MNNIINAPSFVRGDSYPFKIKIKDKNGNPIHIEDIKSLFITFKHDTRRDSKIIFQKTLLDVDIDNEGYCHCIFNPEDTETLTYGPYFFDIEVTLINGYRKTSIYSIELTDETSTHGGY